MADERCCADCGALYAPEDAKCPQCGSAIKIAYIHPAENVLSFSSNSIDLKLVIFSKQAAKILKRLDVPTKQRIKDGILGIPQGDIKPLKGATGVYRLRIGDWRILFSHMDGNEIFIRDIGPRGGIYKGV